MVEIWDREMKIYGERAALKEVVAIKRKSRHIASILLMLILCKVEIKRKAIKTEKWGYFKLIYYYPA